MYYEIKNKLKDIKKYILKNTYWQKLVSIVPFLLRREYEVMSPFSKNPITFGWKQVIQYMTSVTCYSVEKITVPNLS